MKANEILEDLYRVREDHARECNYDVNTIFARMKDRLKELEAECWRIVSPAPREKTVIVALREAKTEPRTGR